MPAPLFTFASMNGNCVHPLEQKILMNIINIVLVCGENYNLVHDQSTPKTKLNSYIAKFYLFQ